MSELPINSLEYDEIRENFISFLQTQTDPDTGDPIYQDWNYLASGISAIINTLAYNTHYLGYYVKMMLAESFIDSAVKHASLWSKAKLTGYVPKDRRSARVDVILEVVIDTLVDNEPSSQRILIPRGTSFAGANSEFDTRTFFVIDDVYIRNRQEDTPAANQVTYTSDPITVYEGTFQTWNFKVDTSLRNQRYVIAQPNIDVDTIRVNVAPTGSTNVEDYQLADKLFEVLPTDRVFYISTNEEGYYEIIFGNGIFGYAPTNDSIATVTFMISNGSSGNGVKQLSFNAPTVEPSVEFNIGNWEDFTATITPTDAVSDGGVERETTDQLRFNIPRHNRRQNRLVTVDDYRSLLLSEFRNIDSVNIWGGEDHNIKTYGKIFISIKPKASDKLTTTAKRTIETQLLENHAVIGMQPVFVDPEFVNIEVDIRGKVDLKATSASLGQLERATADLIVSYNNDTLNVFDNALSDVKMLDTVITALPEIDSVFSIKTLNKNYLVYYAANVENIVYFGNPLVHGVQSSPFNYGAEVVYYKDNDAGELHIYKQSDGTKLVTTPQGRVDYDKGQVYFTFPTFATTITNDFGNAGIINFRVKPMNPDIDTQLQNIVRITKVDVRLTAAA